MPRSGTGQYSLPNPPFVVDTVIDQTVMNGDLSDIASALTGSVASDGQTPMTGALNMNSHKITGISSPTSVGDAVQFGQFEQSLASPGYIGLPKSSGTGFIIQAGTATTDAGGNYTLTFPRAFATACLGVWGSLQWASGAGGFMYTLGAPTTTGASLKMLDHTGGAKAANFSWIAFGY